MSQVAHAGRMGTVMALFAPPQGVDVQAGIVLTLTAADGTATKVSLHDDGVIPDQTAGDGTFTGGNWYAGGPVTGVLSIGAHAYAPTNFTPATGEGSPRIYISLDGDVVLLDPIESAPQGGGDRSAAKDALKGGGPPPEGATDPERGPGQKGPPPPGEGPDPLKKGPLPEGEAVSNLGGGPSGAGGSTYGAGGGTGGATGSSGGASGSAGGATVGSPWAWAAFLGGGVLAAGAALWWSRQRSGGVAGRSAAHPESLSGWRRLPGAGLGGGAVPSLSDGLTVWVVPEEQKDDVIAPVLSALAREGRVLVVGPPERAIPRVHGGTVYRLPASSPEDIAATLGTLSGDPAEGVSLLLLDADPAALVDLADALPVGAGAVALTTVSAGLPSLPRVDCWREGGRWMVRYRGNTRRLDDTAEGACAAS